jgi:hypothetical protein
MSQPISAEREVAGGKSIAWVTHQGPGSVIQYRRIRHLAAIPDPARASNTAMWLDKVALLSLAHVLDLLGDVLDVQPISAARAPQPGLLLRPGDDVGVL